jgi:hypothetical protein
VGESTLQFVGCEDFDSAINGAELDIVFVHGLGGDPFLTWSVSHDRADYWPLWIAKDIRAANIWAAGYDSGLFASALAGSGASIGDHASSLIDLVVSRLTAKRLVFVAHSLGGLIVKQILRKCSDSSNAD